MGTSQAGTATSSIRTVKTLRPPKRSASMPTGSRASEPRRTGIATRSAVCVALRPNISRKRGAKAETSPQAAKQTANDRVPSARGRALDGAGFELIGFLLIPAETLTQEHRIASHPEGWAGRARRRQL